MKLVRIEAKEPGKNSSTFIDGVIVGYDKVIYKIVGNDNQVHYVPRYIVKEILQLRTLRKSEELNITKIVLTENEIRKTKKKLALLKEDMSTFAKDVSNSIKLSVVS